MARRLLSAPAAGALLLGVAAACGGVQREAAIQPSPPAAEAPCAAGPGRVAATPAFTLCLPPGWAESAYADSEASASGEWQRDGRTLRWLVGPFRRGLPPDLRTGMRHYSASWREVLAGRDAELYRTSEKDTASAVVHVYWPETDSAPATILVGRGVAGRGVEDLLAAIRSIRFTGRHARPAASFFPAGVFGPGRAPIDEFVTKWYSRHLRAMREPRLTASPGPGGAAEAYRLLLLPTWGRPTAVRLERHAGGGQRHLLVVKVLGGWGGYEPGAVIRADSAEVPADVWDALIRRVDSAGFWAMPTSVVSFGRDGTRWILEGRRGDSYHVVDRWEGGTAEFRALCTILLDLAKLGAGGRDRD